MCLFQGYLHWIEGYFLEGITQRNQYEVGRIYMKVYSVDG